MRDVALRRKEPISEYCKVCNMMFIISSCYSFCLQDIAARKLGSMAYSCYGTGNLDGHIGIPGRKRTVVF